MPTRPVIIDGQMSIDGAAAVPVHIEGTATWEDAPPPVIEPTPPDAHAYFDALAAREEATWVNARESAASHHAWSLRSDDEIAAVTNKPPQTPLTGWSYDYAGDAYADKQDAAKFCLDPAALPADHPDADPPRGAILLFPVGVSLHGTDTLLITWDHFYGREWLENIGTTGTWKHYNLYNGGSVEDRNPYIGPKVYWSRADETTGDGAGPASVGKHGQTLLPSNRAHEVAGHDRTDGLVNTGAGAHKDGCVGKDGHFHVQADVWGRYWLEVHCGVPGSDARFASWKTTDLYIAATEAHKAAFEAGTWLCINCWYADGARGPVRLMYGVPWIIRDDEMFSLFGFEFDSSATRSNLRGPGYPLIGYWRNVVALRNYTSPGATIGVDPGDPLIFQQP